MVRLVLAVAGVLFVLWLVFAELFVIRAICLWCSVMHVLTFALFVLIALFGVGRAPTETNPLEEKTSDTRAV
jgi:uncharacterized membrane protein